VAKLKRLAQFDDVEMASIGAKAIAPGARTRIVTLVALGRTPELVSNEALMEGVNAGRKTIPFARFDAKRCAQASGALRSYQTEWDTKARAFKTTPKHNWAPHGADGAGQHFLGEPVAVEQA
jgi:phage terminase large subunit